jgi:hypothetical protein
MAMLPVRGEAMTERAGARSRRRTEHSNLVGSKSLNLINRL